MSMPPAQFRKSPSEGMARCQKCSYVIEGLDKNRCPECGQPFDPADPTTFTTRPPLARWRFWLSRLFFSLGLGVVMFPILIYLTGGIGWGITLGIPFSLGAILSYCLRAHWVALILALLVLLPALVLAYISSQITGLYCGLYLGALFMIPMIFGAVLGWIFGFTLKRFRFSQRNYLPLLAFILIPIIWSLIEAGIEHPKTFVTIQSSATVNASLETTWGSIVFFEEVGDDPPLLLRLGLPKPLYTTGRADQVGAVKVCVYDRGHLTKQVTEFEPEKRLAFKVIEQDIHFERSVNLIGGQFELKSISPRQTRVTLTTEYEALLRPRFCWIIGEELAVHTLHRYVLAGMRARAEAENLSSARAVPENNLDHPH